MKNFIKIHQTETDLPVLINIAKIHNVEKTSHNDKFSNCIIWLDGGMKFYPSETYDEIVKKIEETV